MTITNITTVPLASANISFFWKMRQIVLIDTSLTTPVHRVKAVYVMKKKQGTAYKIAIWVEKDAAGVRQLKIGISDETPGTHEYKSFAFDNNECHVWLDKAIDPTDDAQKDSIIIGTGDIRGVVATGNPAGGVTFIKLNESNTSPVILSCAADYQLTIHAKKVPQTPTEVAYTLVINP